MHFECKNEEQLTDSCYWGTDWGQMLTASLSRLPCGVLCLHQLFSCFWVLTGLGNAEKSESEKEKYQILGKRKAKTFHIEVDVIQTQDTGGIPYHICNSLSFRCSTSGTIFNDRQRIWNTLQSTVITKKCFICVTAVQKETSKQIN